MSGRDRERPEPSPTFNRDNDLGALAAGIVERIGLDPPELKALVQPPRLRVVPGTPGVHCFSLPNGDGNALILVGTDLYPFIHHYTRAAATLFLPRERGGQRPSAAWPKARSALATTLDWLSTPAPAARYPDFDVSPYQAQAARAFADYTFQFVLCHELAHVILGHVEASAARFHGGGLEDAPGLNASHEREYEADQFGLQMQVASIPDRLLLVTAMASAIYFVHITGLLDVRLMLAAGLVDHRYWKIAHTHPPALGRVVRLLGAAEALQAGFQEGLRTVHEALAKLDMELYGLAPKQQERVKAQTLRLIEDEAAGHKPPQKGRKRAGRGANEGTAQDQATAAATPKFLRLFDKSPMGVLRALEAPAGEATGAPVPDEGQRRAQVVEQLAAALPPEFQEFRRLTPKKRAGKLA